MTFRQFLFASVAAIGIAAASPASAQQAAVTVNSDNIGGVVTGPNGPEAGVWVIAETTDLPTRFIKSVVTDDQGRYLIPELPKASYEVFARGYGLADSAKVKSEPGKTVNITATPRDAEGCRRALSGDLLVLDAQDAGRARIPARQRQDAGRVAQRDQDQRLLRLSRARQQGDAHHSVGVRRHEERGRLGAAHPVRPGDDQHGDRDRPPRHAARAQPVRRLDRPRRGRRSARRASRRARRARSATSSSRSGTSPIRSTTCTTSRRPTNASRRSIPTA